MATNDLDDFNFGFEEDFSSLLTFSPEVQEAIDEVLPSVEELDLPNFNHVQYINTIFPTEQSLSNIDAVVAGIQGKIKILDAEIQQVVRGQTNVAEDGSKALYNAQQSIQVLFSKIKEMKDKADASEKMVKEITQDIRQLDHAKRHLTTSITTLNHLYMLIGGVDQLIELTAKREYGEVANLLEGILHVLRHFNPYMSIPHIKKLSNRVEEIKTNLGEQIKHDFEDAFHISAKGSVKSEKLFASACALISQKRSISNIISDDKTMNHSLLAEACFVLDVLDVKVKRNLLKWFTKLQLVEYSLLFADNQDSAWLDKIDKRYMWIKQAMVRFEERLGKIFPPSWEVSEHLCVDFCYTTRSELSHLMTKRRSDIDVKLLLFAIQRTMNFETLCSRRFSGCTIEQSTEIQPEPPKVEGAGNPFEEPSTNPFDKQSTVKRKVSPFIGLITQCFLPYLSIYIESQDRNLAELIARFSEDFTKHGAPKIDAEITSNVLPSCADLFVFYKKCMVQCTQLSTSEALLSLTITFQKYLKIYANKILLANLPRYQDCHSNSTSISYTASGLLQSMFKDGDSSTLSTSRLNTEEKCRTCALLCTAEYCTETALQLAEKLREKIDPHLKAKIDLTSEINIFHGIISNCIQILVKDLEYSCEPALMAMIKLPWSTVEMVGDQSAYITAIIGHLKINIPVLRDNLSASRKYFIQFCIKFATSFLSKYLEMLYKCKNVNTVGAEQLLLDTHSLKTILLDLPSLGSQVARKPPNSYTKIVTKCLSKAELILKVVMSSDLDHTYFIENYVKLLSEHSITELQRVLDMKGIRRTDQTAILDMYHSRYPSLTTTTNGSRAGAASLDSAPPAREVSTARSFLATMAMSTGGNISDQSQSGIRKLEKLIKKRL